MSEMNAEQIKKAILEKKVKSTAKPVEEERILGIKGWLFRSSSYSMEGWRTYVNSVKTDNSPDEEKRKLAPAKLIQISFRDKEGNLVFEELDIPIIGGIDDIEINRVFKRCLSINGYSGEGIEAILKNLIAISGIDGVYASLVNIGAPCPNCGKDTKNTSCESNGSPNITGPVAMQQKVTKPDLSAKSLVKE